VLTKLRRSLSVDERKKYIDAVRCMMLKPAKYDKDFPVVTTRYDDFVALHVNATQGGKRYSAQKKSWSCLTTALTLFSSLRPQACGNDTYTRRWKFF
jgi:hypothetical protein